MRDIVKMIAGTVAMIATLVAFGYAADCQYHASADRSGSYAQHESE